MVRFAGEQPRTVWRFGRDQDQIGPLSVEYEVGLAVQHPATGAPLGGHVRRLRESGHRRGERAVRDTRQPALTGLPVTASQERVPGQYDGRQQRRRAQHAPGLLQSHGEFGEGVTGATELLGDGERLHPDLAREPFPQQPVVTAGPRRLLADLFGSAGLLQQFSQHHAELAPLLTLQQQRRIGVEPEHTSLPKR